MNQNSLRQVLLRGKDFLKDNQIDSYHIDAQLLLMEAAGLTKIQLLTQDDRCLDSPIIERYQALLAKRAVLMPIQYIVNRCEFMSLDFYVDENVLIPRPDTEILVEEAIAMIRRNQYKNILEIGTGSGCISISLGHYCEDVQITAVDISQKALNIAKKNACTNHVSHKIHFLQSDLFSNLSFLNGDVDVIISNPPYIRKEDIPSLEPNVRDFEPLTALDGGEDGLDFYRAITEQSLGFLKPNGGVLYEIGYNQGQDVKNLCKDFGFESINLIKDLAGLDRVVTGQRYNKLFSPFERIEERV